MRAVLLLGGLAACGRIDFTRIDAADVPGSPDAAHACDPTAPFGAPVPVPGLSDPAFVEGTLRLYPDELRGYYWRRDAANVGRIYYVARPDLDSAFATTQVSFASDVGTTQLDPTFPPDGSLLVYRVNGPGDDLYAAQRLTDTTFDVPSSIASVNVGASDVQPFLTTGELVFSSKRTGNGDLYRAPFSAGTFGGPQLIDELAGTFEEGDPAMTADGLTIYFRSMRPPSQAFDIWVAHRGAIGAPFTSIELVPNVNGPTDDGPSWVSPDDCRLYLSSDRAGTNDVYVATRGT